MLTSALVVVANVIDGSSADSEGPVGEHLLHNKKRRVCQATGARSCVQRASAVVIIHRTPADKVLGEDRVFSVEYDRHGAVLDDHYMAQVPTEQPKVFCVAVLLVPAPIPKNEVIKHCVIRVHPLQHGPSNALHARSPQNYLNKAVL